MTLEPYWIDHVAATDLAWAVAQRVAQQLRVALQERARATLVLGDGALVQPICQRLADAVLDWRRVDVIVAEEPWQGPTDPNGRSQQLALWFGRGEARQAAVLPLLMGTGTAGDDARAAAFELRRVPRPFDLAVVAVGDDGRVGSLVPGSHGLAQLLDAGTPPTVAAVDVADDERPHLTLTLSALVDARTILALGQGRATAAAVERALGGADLPVAALLQVAAVPIEFHFCPSEVP